MPNSTVILFHTVGDGVNEEELAGEGMILILRHTQSIMVRKITFDLIPSETFRAKASEGIKMYVFCRMHFSENDETENELEVSFSLFGLRDKSTIFHVSK